MEENLFFAVLRISAAQMLRNAGIAGARPSALDAFTDIMGRYITLLGATCRAIADSTGRTNIEINDARAAMEHLGLLRPIRLFEDPHGDDTRGVDAFIEWAKGPIPAEMRRIAGVGLAEDEDADVPPPPDGAEGGEVRTAPAKKVVDWLTILKHKELKSGDEERYKGTVLGTHAGPKPIVVEGADKVDWALP